MGVPKFIDSFVGEGLFLFLLYLMVRVILGYKSRIRNAKGKETGAIIIMVTIIITVYMKTYSVLGTVLGAFSTFSSLILKFTFGQILLATFHS